MSQIQSETQNTTAKKRQKENVTLSGFAKQALKKEPDPLKAVYSFAREVIKHNLVLELVGRAVIIEAGRKYLERHTFVDTQSADAKSHSLSDTQPKFASQNRRENQATSANGKGHVQTANHVRNAVKTGPSKSQLEANKRAIKKLTVHDTFVLQLNNTPVGDIYVESLDNLIHKAGKSSHVASKEYSLLILMKAHEKFQSAHIPDGAQVRDLLSVEETSALINQAQGTARAIDNIVNGAMG